MKQPYTSNRLDLLLPKRGGDLLVSRHNGPYPVGDFVSFPYPDGIAVLFEWVLDYLAHGVPPSRDEPYPLNLLTPAQQANFEKQHFTTLLSMTSDGCLVLSPFVKTHGSLGAIGDRKQDIKLPKSVTAKKFGEALEQVFSRCA